jgi:hypothetical protein
MRIIGGDRLVGNANATSIFALQEMLYLGTLRQITEVRDASCSVVFESLCSTRKKRFANASEFRIVK